MNSPNLQQRIYLAKALNENTDTLFDHPQMNEEEMGEESITEGAKRKARLLRAMTSGKNFGDLEIAKKRETAYDSELGRRVARKLRKGGAPKRTIAKFFNKDTKTSPAVDKAIARFNEKELAIQQKLRAMGKNISEGIDLYEGSYVHSKGQLKKSIKGSKREIVKAMKKGNKEEASFWMQNKKDAEEQLKEATRSKAMKTYRMKKAGKASDEQLHQANLKSDISRLRRGGASSTTLKNAAAAARRGFNYEQNPYDDDDDSGTIHPASYDPKHEIDAEYQFQLRSRRSRKAARAAGKAVPSLKEGSLGQKRVKRVFKSKRDDMKFQDSTIAKTRNLVTRKVLRAGADPRDVATRMKDSSANLRTLNALQRFNDEARLKSKYPALRKK
jgi:hypothetical protein